MREEGNNHYLHNINLKHLKDICNGVFIYYSSLTPSEREDIIAMVYSSIIDRLSKPDEIHKIDNYIYTIAVNAVHKFNKEKTKENFIPIDDVPFSIIMVDEDPTAVRFKELIEMVEKMQLEEEERSLFNLTFIELQSGVKAAEILGVSPKTISKRKKILLNKIKSHVKSFKIYL